MNSRKLSITLNILLVTLLLSSCGTTTYYLVRHAEKADNSRDPLLSPAGSSRAVSLKDSLIRKNIKAIYVTNYQRTQQTAAPLAQALRITSIALPAASTQSLIDSLLRKKGSQSFLVVGHSNTVPVIIDSLMKSAQQIAITENDFDNFYTVSIKHGLRTKRKLIISQYGMKTP